MSHVVLKKGGKLSLHRYQTLADRGQDVTGFAHRFLFHCCEIEKGVSLRDAFLLIQRSLNKFDQIFVECSCKEIVAEGLSKRLRRPGSGPDKIEYLELYKTFYAAIKEESYGLSHPNFHGVGFKLKKAKISSLGRVEEKKGARVQWAISLSPAYKLTPLPLVLNRKMVVFDNNIKSKAWGKQIAEYNNITYTLGEVLHGILWELSYHGAPAKRKKFALELRSRMERVRTGQEKRSPAAEVFKKSRRRAK